MIRSNDSVYWVLRGQVGERQIRWSTAPLGLARTSEEQAREQAAPTEPRIIEPPSEFWAAAAAQEPGAAPELTQVQLVVSNADGALTPLLLGATHTAQEFTGASILQLRGRLYLGHGSPRREVVVTPTLVVSSAVEIDAHRVHLTLTADDRILSSTMPSWTADELIGPAVEIELSDTLQAWADDVGLSAHDLWHMAQRAMADHTSTVPVIWGSSDVPLIALGADGYSPAWYVAGIDALERPIGAWQAGAYRRTDGLLVRMATNIALIAAPMAVHRDIDVEGGARRVVLILFADLSGSETSSVRKPLEAWASPSAFGSSVANAGPAGMARQVVRWAEEMAPPTDPDWQLDEPSWDAAIQHQDEWASAIGGLVRTAAPVSSALAELASLGDLRYYIAPTRLIDSQLRGGLGVMLGSVPYEEIHAARLADLPHIEAADIVPADASRAPAFRQSIPAGPDDANAVAARVVIDWPEDIRELHPITTAMTRYHHDSPNASPMAELVVSGAWLRPSRARSVLPAIADRARYPSRMVEVTTHLGAAELMVGSLVRVSSELGLSAEGTPWERRLCRLEGIRIMPADAACRLLLRDLGPLEAMRLGLLDSEQHWILYRYSGAFLPGLRVEAVDQVVWDAPSLLPGDTSDYIDATLWTWGDGLPRELRRSWRIRERLGNYLWRVEPSEPLPPDLVQPTYYRFPPRDFQVMRTHMQAGADFRPDYIRGAAPDGFEDGEPPFQYSRL